MDSSNPYTTPQSESRPAMSTIGPVGLGSLAQAARDKEIGQARWTLIAVGILTLVVNAMRMQNLPNEIMEALRKNPVDPAQAEQVQQALMAFGLIIYGGAGLLGVVFIILGVIVKKFPVAITITALVLYLLVTLGFGVLDLNSLIKGGVIKLLIVVGLIRAVKAALAYQNDTKKAATGALLE